MRRSKTIITWINLVLKVKHIFFFPNAESLRQYVGVSGYAVNGPSWSPLPQARKASAAAKTIQQAPAPAPAPTVPMSPCLSYKTAVPRGGVAAAQDSDKNRAEFKAKPVPRFEPPSDSRPEPSVTVPKPFALQTDQRGTLKSRQMHEQIEAQQAKERDTS